MAIRRLIVAQLFERNRARLQLSWVCGNLNRAITVPYEDISPADLVGHLNLIHPDRLQVLGAPEVAWMSQQTAEQVADHLRKIIAAQPPALIIADGCDIPPTVQAECDASDTPLFTTPHQAAAVIDSLRLYVSRQLAETVTLHGVFMDVLGIGVLITGDSGVGKSELALELISRSHGLVADDVVEISRVGPDTLEGRCPELLRDFLEVRGLGLLNIRTVFGETACRRKMRLKMVVNLQRPAPSSDVQRLPLDAQTETILGVPIRKVILPVAAGRNLAVLLETAVRTTILLLRGVDSMQEFLDRQQRALENGVSE
ncbi:MAG: HPr(Ser) kinase/phosphatase [Candidatus Nitricoxidivorans perseverans]|uniref:HPr kinase/phosphorylase n=1 Tax=Candidatus Nitricoxidivorans perseverans TaxID=2975601 RepID=A0AA49IXT1_9PROT|nr:MAG: HPr(Ser) kinase/phosphatase [Candidatus Nitricoxidivorans perseverans]